MFTENSSHDPATHIRNMHGETFDFFLFRLGSFLLGVATEQVIRITAGTCPK